MLLDYLQLTPEDLETEHQQLTDAGRQVSALTAEFNALVEPSSNAAESPDWQTAAVDLLDQAADLPNRSEYPYHEPNELEAIRTARPDGSRSLDIEVDLDALGVSEEGLLLALLDIYAGSLLRSRRCRSPKSQKRTARAHLRLRYRPPGYRDLMADLECRLE